MGSVTCQRESIDGLPPLPKSEGYREVEGRGLLRVYTARAAGTLVGYSVVVVTEGLHYATSMQGVEYLLFLAPEFGEGAQLIQFADRELAAEGVQVVYRRSKVKSECDLGPLFKEMGYVPVDVIYSKSTKRT